MENEKTSENQPYQKFVAGGVSATIWSNKAEKEGKEIEYKTISIERSYKDKEDNWRKTSSMRLSDLPKVELVSRKAFEFLTLRD